MISLTEESQLRELCADALMLILKNTVSFEKQLAVKGLVGLSIDGEQVCMIDLNNVLDKSKQSTVNSATNIQERFGRIGGAAVVEGVNKNVHREDTRLSSKKRVRSDPDDAPKDLTALFSEVEQLSSRVEHKISRKKRKLNVSEPELEQNKSAVVIEQLEKKNVSNDENNEGEVILPPPDDVPTFLPMHETNESPEPQTFRDNELNSALQETTDTEVVVVGGTQEEWWARSKGDNNSIYSITPQDNSSIQTVLHEDGPIQTIIVGGRNTSQENNALSSLLPEAGKVEYVNSEGATGEDVLVMTGMEAEAVSALHLMQPGETFEYNGITYQIASDDLTGEVSSMPFEGADLEPKVEQGIAVKKGNHTRSNKPKKFMCTICVQQFTTSWGLKLHERLHRGEFRYRCTICNKGFTSTVNLQGHMSYHSKQKEFECERCSKAFSYRQSLERHQLKACRGSRRPPLTPKREEKENNDMLMKMVDDHVVEIEAVEVPSLE